MESDHITLLLALQQEMKILNRRASLSPPAGEQGDEKEASQGVRGPIGGGGRAGGMGTGIAAKVTENGLANNDLPVSFDLESLYIPPLTSSTAKFLGLPLPPFLKIEVVPEALHGSINQESGKVDLEFKAKFLFSAGSLYKAPPLLVKTVLTSEETKGTMKSGRGRRLDKEGKCRLVGVATVDPIDDFFMNSFLGLPTECLAELKAVISISSSS
ncbi:hypothetical protein ACSQ67_009031 [Phaseolus vulgaris]